MTPPPLTCEHCEEPIDFAADPRAVVASVTGHADVMCEACRQRAYDRWRESQAPGPERGCEALREAYRIKRGWSA